MRLRALRPYLAIVGARFRTLLQYRAAALAGAGTQALFGLVRLMVLEAFYRSTAAPQPLGFGQVVAYIWLGQITFTLQPYNLDRDVRALVRTGTVAYELVRPVDLYGFWYARAVAWRTAPMLLRTLPMLVLALVLLPLAGLGEWALPPPASAAAGALWLVALAGALAVSAAITTLMSISLLWTISGEGVAILLASVVSLFSGMIIPLPLFPDWAQPLLKMLPFAGLMDLPARIYTGNIPASQAGWALVHQAGWTLLLVALGRWLLARSARRLVVQGG
jgi:ABC-2 type transport system permease protein